MDMHIYIHSCLNSYLFMYNNDVNNAHIYQDPIIKPFRDVRFFYRRGRTIFYISRWPC